MRHGTYSIVARDPETGELGVAVQSHWFSVGSVVTWARAGRRGGRDAVGRRARLRPAAARAAAGGEDARGGARPRCSPPTRWRACARWRSSTRAARVGRPHRRGLHRRTPGHVDGRRLQLPGQHDGRATPSRPAMAAAFEAADGDARRPPARRAARGRGARAATSAAASRRRCSSSPAEGERVARRVDLRVEDHADPLAELERLLDPAARLRAGGRGRRAARRRGAPTRPARCYRARGRAGARTPTSCCSGPGCRWPTPATSTAASTRSGAPPGRNPNWLVLLDRLTPEFAPQASRAARARPGLNASSADHLQMERGRGAAGSSGWSTGRGSCSPGRPRPRTRRRSRVPIGGRCV